MDGKKPRKRSGPSGIYWTWYFPDEDGWVNPDHSEANLPANLFDAMKDNHPTWGRGDWFLQYSSEEKAMVAMRKAMGE